MLRQERGLSRKELADKIGVNFQTVGYLEREEYNPSLDLAFRICEVFKVPVDFVFSTKAMQPISEELTGNGEQGTGNGEIQLNKEDI